MRRDGCGARSPDEGRILASVVASQAELHAPFGGVVPESPRAATSSSSARRPGGPRARERDTRRRRSRRGDARTGLVGALLVGLRAAKAIAWARPLPLVPVDHLTATLRPSSSAGPARAAFLVPARERRPHDAARRARPRPVTVLGWTLDDAAGEAFDKGARLLGLGYPGGRELDRLAREGDPAAFSFPVARVDGLDFSFSGVKTALLYAVTRPRRRGAEAAAPTSPPPISARSSARSSSGRRRRRSRRESTGSPSSAVSPRTRSCALPCRCRACAARALHRQRGDDRLGREIRGAVPSPIPCARCVRLASLSLAAVRSSSAAWPVSLRSSPSPASATAAQPSAAQPAVSWQGLVGTPAPVGAARQRMIVVLKASVARGPRPARRRAGDEAGAALDEQRWRASSSSSLELRGAGRRDPPRAQFTRVVTAFRAAADPSAVSLLERSPRVAGIYPVGSRIRRRSAASARRRRLGERRSRPSRLRGRGVTVALLDTGVDRRTPSLHGRVCPGFDIIRGGAAARYDQKPGDDRLERTARAWRGSSPARAAPARPGVSPPTSTVLPIRVAGWQRDAQASWSIYGRTDQLIAGLERAVDPTGTATRTMPLASPWFPCPSRSPRSPTARFRRPSPAPSRSTRSSSFPRGTTALAGRALAGSPALGVLPKRSPPAPPTCGRRPQASRVSVRAGLEVLLHRPLELLTAIAPEAGASFEVVRVGKPANLLRPQGQEPRGRSGGAPGVGLRTAQRRRASGGRRCRGRDPCRGGLPGGALGLDPRLAVPVLSAPGSLVPLVREGARDGSAVSLSIGAGDAERPTPAASPAAFSSWGYSFGAQVKPDVVAPGVAVATALARCRQRRFLALCHRQRN